MNVEKLDDFINTLGVSEEKRKLIKESLIIKTESLLKDSVSCKDIELQLKATKTANKVGHAVTDFFGKMGDVFEDLKNDLKD